MHFVKEWELIDPSCYEWQGTYDDEEAYQFLAVTSPDNESFYVVSAFMDYDLYKDLKSMKLLYPYETKTKMMFLFETDELHDPSNFIEKCDSFEEACHFIDRRKQWCEKPSD